MNLLLVFILLQAILRVKFVLNSKIKLIGEESDDFDEEEYDDYQGIKQAKPAALVSGILSFNDAPSPIENSPISVIEMNFEDAFEITKEWIENYLIPTFKTDKMIPKSVIKKVKMEK